VGDEGARLRRQDRIYLFHTSPGSAAEVVAALELAAAWAYVSASNIGPAMSKLGQLLTILWRLTEQQACH
jgi:hypothetical protein